MTTLRDAARALGLKLSGATLPRSGRILDRPALVFLKRGPHGHFAVIRPVGRTGKLVQVIDPNREPEVIDAADLMTMPEWTGLALIPDRPNRVVQAAIALTAVVALALGMVYTIPNLRRLRPVGRT